MGKNSIIIIVFSSAVFCGCRKDAVDANSSLEGTWCTSYYGPTEGAIITINKSGNSEYNLRPCCGAGSEQNFEGPAKLDDRELKIGKKKMTINIFPGTDENGNYKMMVDGTDFYAVMTPTNQAATVSGTTATFTWDPPSNVDAGLGQTTILEYRVQDTFSWTEITIDIPALHPNYILTGLSSATTYEWALGSACGNHKAFNSTINTFTTQ